jgi:hypothetical protein
VQIQLHSPLDVLFELPFAYVAAGGAAALIGFLRGVEHVWNFRRRIRLEAAELDRDYLDAVREWEEAAEQLRSDRLGRNVVSEGRIETDRDEDPEEPFVPPKGFYLTDGELLIPRGWDWPERGREG